MSQAQTKDTKRNLRPKPGKGSNASKQKELPLEISEEKKEERKFVPWLGEARPKRGPIYDIEGKIGTKLNVVFLSGRTIEGVLESTDRSTNLVLENTVEFLDEQKTRNLGKVFVCGRVESISPA